MESSTGDIVRQLDQIRVHIDAFTPDDAQARRDLRASALALASTLSSPEDIFADAFYQVEFGLSKSFNVAFELIRNVASIGGSYSSCNGGSMATVFS